MNLGQEILEALTMTHLFEVIPPPHEGGAAIIVWSSGAAEQLEAIALESLKRAGYKVEAPE